MNEGPGRPRRLARALLFDLDGTLIDSARDLTEAVNAALAELGQPPRSVAEIRRFTGDGARELIRRAAGPGADLATAEAAFRRHYARICVESTQPYPGIPELLARHAGLPLAVVSNKPADLCRTILDRLGLLGRFRAVVGGESGRGLKPDPAPVEAALAALGVPRTGAVLVGDGAQDLQAAGAAGIPALGAGWGFRPWSQWRSLPCAAVFLTPRELDRWLSGCEGAWGS
jgi:phosphoglycolate phosphatase